MRLPTSKRILETARAYPRLTTVVITILVMLALCLILGMAPAEDWQARCGEPALAVRVELDGRPVACVTADEMSRALLQGLVAQKGGEQSVAVTIRLWSRDLMRTGAP